MNALKSFFKEYCQELKQTIDTINPDSMEQLYQEMDAARTRQSRIFVLGNGGSAAAASHWVCDFGKGINTKDSIRMKISSPADSLSLLTAIGNDFSYEDVFYEPLKNELQANDLVISLSVSGNSPNLVKAHHLAHERGARTVAIVGDYGGALLKCSDLVLTITSKNYGIVEDLHMSIDHAISQYMRLQNMQLQQ